jgi:hypothetical protein
MMVRGLDTNFPSDYTLEEVPGNREELSGGKNRKGQKVKEEGTCSFLFYFTFCLVTSPVTSQAATKIE